MVSGNVKSEPALAAKGRFARSWKRFVSANTIDNAVAKSFCKRGKWSNRPNGAPVRFHLNADDPRVSGAASLDFNIDGYH